MNELRYKYLPFTIGSLCILTKGTIKFSHPEEFNDPFDCAPDFHPEKHGQYAIEQKELLKEVGKNLGMSPGDRLLYKRRMAKIVENAARNGNYNAPEIWNLGICCLSRTPLNLLMWAHYAQNHKGFVVEFDLPTVSYQTEQELLKKVFEWLIPMRVSYVEEKPLIDPYDDQDTNMRKNFLTKGIDWSYEMEERVMDHVRGVGIHPYDRTKILKSVIAGMRMSNNDYVKLREIVNTINAELGTDVQLHKAKPVPRKYALFVDNRPDLCVERL